MDLHPYDGATRRFAHDEDGEARARALPIIDRLLGVALSRPPPPALRYEMSFYSGGLGVVDKLRISLPADAAPLDAVVRALGLVCATALRADEDIRWLVGAEDDASESDVDAQIVAFIAGEKAPFQPALPRGDAAYFAPGSGVNAWTVVYLAEGALHYVGFDQG